MAWGYQTVGAPRPEAPVSPPEPYSSGFSPHPGAPPASRRSEGPARPSGFHSEDDYIPPQEHTTSHTGLLIAVGVVVLLAVIGLTAFMWPRDGSNPQFPIGSCVKENPDEMPVAADCTAAGAFTVVKRVQNKEQCPDPLQPYIELGSGRARILCLAPANGAAATSTPATGTPVPQRT